MLGLYSAPRNPLGLIHSLYWSSQYQLVFDTGRDGDRDRDRDRDRAC
jgi:hypothetical protein